MPTGIASGPWGYTPRWVARMDQAPEIGKHPLFFEQPMTSIPGTFRGKMFKSPLTIANEPLYTRNTRFGACARRSTKSKKKIFNKNRCILFLQSDRTINPISGRTLLKNGPTYNHIIEKCVKYNLIKQPRPEVKMELSGQISKRSIGSGTLQRMYTNTGSGSDIFVGSLPEPPDERMPLNYYKPGGFTKSTGVGTTSPTMASVGTNYSTEPVNYSTEPIGRVTRSKSMAQSTAKPTPGLSLKQFRVNSVEDPKYIVIGEKRFVKDDQAIIHDDGQTGTILKIGPRQIVLWNNVTKKERHLTHSGFYKLNK